MIDVSENNLVELVRAEGLVRQLDTEMPQVLIEARIVEAATNYNRALGVQWGGQGNMNQANGNPTGFIFPNNITATGAAGGDPTTGVSATPNYAVNLPAAIGQGSGGGLGFDGRFFQERIHSFESVGFRQAAQRSEDQFQVAVRARAREQFAVFGGHAGIGP